MCVLIDDQVGEILGFWRQVAAKKDPDSEAGWVKRSEFDRYETLPKNK